MIQASFLEQLKTLGNIIVSNKYIFYVAIIALGSIIGLELTNKIKSKKILKLVCILVYFFVFGILLYFYYDTVYTLFDYLVNNIFLLLFFPNLAVYTLVIIIINIILIKSILKDKKIVKRMNIIFFVLFNVMFFLIIENIIDNNINIYEQLSIYTNKELLILITLSMEIFIIWIVLLCIIKITNHLSLSFAYNKEPSLVHKKVNSFELEKIKKYDENNNLPKNDSLIPNTLVLEPVKDSEYVDIKPVNYYNEFLDVEPVKKRKSTNLLSDMDSLFKVRNSINRKDMDIVFKNQYVKSIMDDIEKLKYNQDDKSQIKKVYEDITLNQKDLTLDDYNTLIHKLTEIKNNY